VAVAIGNLPVDDSCVQTGGLTCPPANPVEAEIVGIKIQDTP
jgi:hypothetical protein